MKFNAVVFDMDGVMFDTESVCMKAWDTVGEEMGIGKAGYMVYKTLGMTAESAIKVLQNEFGVDFDARLFKQKGREFSYKYFDEFGVPEKPFLHETLNYLKIKDISLQWRLQRAVTAYFITLTKKHHRLFDKVICGDMIKNSKPAPDIYLKACEELGENPANCIAIEDSKNGILSAKNADMNVIMIPDLWHGDDDTDKLLFAKLKSLGEINTIL